jgi:hypothetical protein
MNDIYAAGQSYCRAEIRKIGVAYRDSYPDTIMTRVKSAPLLPCWTWTVFLIFMFWSGALVCLILQIIGG